MFGVIGEQYGAKKITGFFDILYTNNEYESMQTRRSTLETKKSLHR